MPIIVKLKLFICSIQSDFSINIFPHFFRQNSSNFLKRRKRNSPKATNHIAKTVILKKNVSPLNRRCANGKVWKVTFARKDKHTRSDGRLFHRTNYRKSTILVEIESSKKRRIHRGKADEPGPTHTEEIEKKREIRLRKGRKTCYVFWSEQCQKNTSNIYRPNKATSTSQHTTDRTQQLCKNSKQNQFPDVSGPKLILRLVSHVLVKTHTHTHIVGCKFREADREKKLLSKYF